MRQDENEVWEKERWEKEVGWAPRFGAGSITEAEANESLLDHTTFLETKLDDKFFGGTISFLSNSANVYKLISHKTGITTLRLSSSPVSHLGLSRY